MKIKQVIALLAMLLAMSYISIHHSYQGGDINIEETGVAAQIESTEIQTENIEIVSGVSDTLQNVWNTENNKIIYNVGFATENLNVRMFPNTESEILGVIDFNTEIMYSKFNDDWYVIDFCGTVAYINSAYVSDIPTAFVDMETPLNDSFKSYMDYQAITDKTSEQWLLQENAYTNMFGIRAIDGRLCIAVGSYYTIEKGTKIDLIMENGFVIKCILADCKDDKHTDNTNRQNPNGSVVEFVVEKECLPDNVKISGDISDCFPELEGEISYIRIYE